MPAGSKRKLFRAALVVLILIGLPLVVLRSGSKIGLESVLELTTGGIDRLPELLQRIRDFHRVVTRDGKRILEVSAKEASFFKDDAAVVVREPKILFYDGGAPFAEVGSQQARIYFNGVDVDEVRLQGEVRFAADRLHFDRIGSVITAEGSVELRSPELVLRGRSLALDLTNRRLEMDHDVTMRVVKQTPALRPTAPVPEPTIEPAPPEQMSAPG